MVPADSLDKEILNKTIWRLVNVVIRGEKGTDIDGACGQLRQRNSK